MIDIRTYYHTHTSSILLLLGHPLWEHTAPPLLLVYAHPQRYTLQICPPAWTSRDVHPTRPIVPRSKLSETSTRIFCSFVQPGLLLRSYEIIYCMTSLPFFFQIFSWRLLGRDQILRKCSLNPWIWGSLKSQTVVVWMISGYPWEWTPPYYVERWIYIIDIDGNKYMYIYIYNMYMLYIYI